MDGVSGGVMAERGEEEEGRGGPRCEAGQARARDAAELTLFLPLRRLPAPDYREHDG
jgi:hypothetical protein